MSRPPKLRSPLVSRCWSRSRRLPTVDGARRLAALGDLVRIGFNRRFVPQIATLRRRLAGVDSYRSALAFSYRRASWSPVSVRDDALLDLGPHLVDLVRWLLRDEVVEVLNADLANRNVRQYNSGWVAGRPRSRFAPMACTASASRSPTHPLA